ncbi:response regulator [Ktedonobacter robiniae]|uniref:Response regulatory domain-containing protein n=1 Tax=Ktedonobacter robiniae TaxID=2778365 RepID=A0ABQ3V5N1_9CHLR|nr:response regulator [Ktedonobacter robiniae]GHO60323.1 hypothetical protein KSB_87980 [Ktedonobacter robiniae]
MDKSQQAGCEQIYCIHILIVKDDPLLGDLLLDALRQEAYEALHVLSGELALTTLQTIIPALMLLDYHLPGMNGLELVGWLRSQEKWARIPVLLMSADVPREARGKEHLRTLRKPFELETLLQSVAELLVPGA